MGKNGTSLIEVLVAVAIMSVVIVGLTTFIQQSINSQNALTFKAQVDTLTNEIRATLGEPTACINTFNSSTPAAVSLTAALNSLRTEIRNKVNAAAYTTGTTYGDRSAVLTEMRAGGTIDPTATYTTISGYEGQFKLTLLFTSVRTTLGPPTLVRSITINTLTNATNNLVQCYAKAAGADSLWTAVSTGIYYSGGNVGIGTASPIKPLHVVAANGSSSILQLSNSDFVLGTTGSGLFINTGAASGNTYTQINSVINGGANGGDLILGNNVGIGTTAPFAKLDVRGTIANVNTDFVSGSAGSALALNQGYGTGNTYATIQEYNSGGAAYGNIAVNPYGGKVGIGSTYANDTLDIQGTLRVRSGAFGTNGFRFMQNPTGNLELSYIAGGAVFSTPITVYYGGNVGIGTTLPSQLLDVNGTVRAVSFLSTSDARLKKNIETVSGLDSVLRLRGVRFDWKETGKPGIGVLAQEVEPVFPELVNTDASGNKSVNYEGLVAPLIEAVKELSVLKDEVRDLREKMALCQPK